ncbi:hypothetical protein MRX96_046391 [Rhipicephalus microplus]
MAFLSPTIASFNCRGLSRAAKQNAVIELVRARKVDILVLQETYVHRLSQITSFDATFGTRSYWGFGASGSRGVAIILMPRFTGSVLRYFRDTDGRIMWMDLDSGIRIERAEIRIISGVILLLSRPESTGPGIASALATLREELRVALQRRWDGLKAVARAERWEMEAWCSRTILRRHLARKHTPLTSLVDLETGSLVETPDGVLEVAKQFYENLYAEPTPPSADFPFVKNDQVFELCDSPHRGGGASRGLSGYEA